MEKPHAFSYSSLKNKSKKWLALLSTDLELTDEEIIRIYGKRWDMVNSL